MLPQRRFDEDESHFRLKKPPAKSGENPDDQPLFKKRIPKQVVVWEDRSELLP